MLLLLACTPSHTPEQPTIRERLGDRPFLTTLDAPATVALTAGGEVPTDPATCGACHPAFYAEWQQTTHASAMRDLQYFAELSKPDNPRWLCLNCHAPTTPQRPTLVTPESRLTRPIVQLEAVPNPAYVPGREAEGVGCATCHVRRDEDGAGTVVGPGLSTNAPHRVRVDPVGLRGVCERCHAPSGEPISPTFVCWFQTGDELAKNQANVDTCVTCHMPPATRPLMPDQADRATRQHHWVGGGVPKQVSAYDGLLARGWVPGFDLSVATSPLTVTLHNRSGHMVPTADPERHLRVEARVEAADGAVLARAVQRIGQTWDWGDATTGRYANRTSDTRLAGGETRAWQPTLTLDGARLVVEVIHVRLTPANAKGMATAQMDAELRGYWPEVVSLLPTINERYPLASYVARETVDLSTGTRHVATLAELIEDSKALATMPFEEQARRLTIPEGPR